MLNSQIVFIKYFLLVILFINNLSINAQEKELSKKEINNIVALSKAYGIVRHFHPSTEIENFDSWETFLIDGISKVKKTKTNKQLNSVLEDLFKPLAPTIRFSKNNNENYDKSLLSYKTDSLVYKKNVSWGDKGFARFRPAKYEKFYVSTFEKEATNKLKQFLAKPDYNIVYALTSKSFLYLPQTLYIKKNITKPSNKNPYKLHQKDSFSVSDVNVRIGSIIIFWNIMQHFYPYNEILKRDTEDILIQYINEAIKNDTTEEFLNVLERMSYDYKDNHLIIFKNTKDRWQKFMPPFRVEEIEGKIVVVWLDEKSNPDINIGDEIISINDISIEDVYNKTYRLYSGATEGYHKFMTYWRLFQGVENTTVSIKLKQPNGAIITKEYTRTLNLWDYKNFPNNNITYNEYKKDYYYINLANIKQDTLSYLMDDKFPFAKGIIFDERNSNYHKRGKELLGHLSKDTLFAQPMVVPYYYFPNQKKKNIEYTALDVSNWTIVPQFPKYTNNIVFLIDNQMYSGRETTASIVDHFKLSTTVGRETGGTNGNTSMVKLYDLYYFFFTGMEVFQYDGSTFHGIGIKPDVNVEYKLKDLLEGKDTFIEKAKQILN